MWSGICSVPQLQLPLLNRPQHSMLTLNLTTLVNSPFNPDQLNNDATCNNDSESSVYLSTHAVSSCVSILFQVYLNRQPNPRKKLLVPCMLDKPNPKCYVCSEKPEVTVRLNVNTMTVHALEEKVCD